MRVVHHPRNLGYGAAVRSGLAASRYPLVCFTDGDRQFRVADIGRLLHRLDESGADVVVGYRLRRADPALRLAYARAYRLSLRLLFGLRVRDPDCACKLFRRTALEGIAVESDGAFLSAELLDQDRGAWPAHRRDRGAASPADGWSRIRGGPACRAPRGA